MKKSDIILIVSFVVFLLLFIGLSINSPACGLTIIVLWVTIALLIKLGGYSKNRADREIWIRVCPQCHSKEVTSRGVISRDALSPNYVCRSCGFQSPLFPEIRLEDAEILPEKPRHFIPSRMPVFADYSRITLVIVILILFWLLLSY